MRTVRIYHPTQLSVGSTVQLSDDAANHVGRVLRLGAGAPLELFCGDDNVYAARIEQANKKHVQVHIDSAEPRSLESPLSVHLVQGISRGDRMDFTLQKSVELGVASITPIFTARCGVKLQGERLEKKRTQWQKIVIAACEQSGRNRVPMVHPPTTLTDFLADPAHPFTLTLEPSADKSIKDAKIPHEVALLIGPEGGFDPDEVALTHQAGCLPVRLGPRVLRTETAALTALAALQANYGDLI